MSGTFYPGRAPDLQAQVQRLLDDNAPQEAQAAPPRALIVPHAGLVYSGPVAASAYNLLRTHAQAYARVLLLGPNHRMPLRSMAVPSTAGFACPLGVMKLDTARLRDWVDHGWVEYNDEVHRLEHCIEVQLPFLLSANPHWQLLPVIAGQAPKEAVAELIGRGLDSADTLVVVSSDLSHYHSYGIAQRIDRATSQHIERLEADLLPDQACGCVAVNGLLRAAARRGLSVHCVDLRNSGDTAGPRDRVVGYGAYAFA
ncbi:AmmeMemoRadiSam system protein B [Marinobacterium rhizophilum]|uniref:AmmeMemoRadiSam system protein B n=1 Tax=Marinobacterium rhizophilum TaxID=420402 RepID=A0ABY5HQD7_9GAMM|nr:AmmeMemoRadiSam system protein B [Marinobacterium rhizophilum]